MTAQHNESNITVLLIEDVEADRFAVERALSRSDGGDVRYELRACGDLASGLSALDEAAADVVLLDLGLLDVQGLDALRQVRAAAPDVAVLIVTGIKPNADLARAAFALGAEDFVEKSELDARHLGKAICYAIDRFRLRGKLHREVTVDDEAIAMRLGQILDLALENASLNQKLRDADRCKDEFLAVLSHELRSPLNVISGHAELLRYEDPATPEFIQSLDAIARNARAQTQLVNDLLEVSRIITGKLKLDVSVFDVRPVLRAAVDSVRFAAEAREVELVVTIDDAVGPITGEPERLQQVLWNLLSNAVKFTPKGGRVTFATRMRNSSVEFTVQDTGQGISADFLPHVFDRLQQEDYSKTRRYGGLGLGLSIVRYVTEMHGGYVRAASEGKDKGATFTVVIPVRTVREERADALTPAAQANATERPLSSVTSEVLMGLRVLVVDDQAEARDLVRKACMLAGATVSVACSAADALSLCKGRRFDAVISDLGMPGMNGLDFVRHLRRYEAEQGARPVLVAALTAYASPEDRRAAREAGVDEYLTKPVGIAELIGFIALGRRAERPPTRSPLATS